jgi:chromate transport protein ChrA
MILAVAPAVRSIHALPRLRQTMSTIGAAIVAAILVLVIRLAADAFSPAGLLKLLPIVVALTAGITLYRGWASAPVVVAAAAAIGLLDRS